MTVLEIYAGSDGEATKRLYERLRAVGPEGLIAENLFRAHKSSGRAKVYRGGLRGRGSYRGMAYEKKQWSLENLCRVLATGKAPALRWGWKEDLGQSYHRWVCYVDLPTGQVSFHSAMRGTGPEYPGEWDGVKDAGAGRIVAWVEELLGERPTPTEKGGGELVEGTLAL